MEKEITEEELKKEKIKNEIVEELIKSGLITTSEELKELFSDLQSRMYQCFLEAELNVHLKGNKNNKRNGYAEKPREVRTKAGTKTTIHMPRDRVGTFKPIIVKKRQRIIDDFSNLVTVLYSKGNTLKDITEIIKRIYKIELSKTFISELISKVNEDIVKWQERKLKEIYTMTYVDCLYCTVKVNGGSKKVAVYVIIGIDLEGKKEVIGIWIGDGSESATFWIGVLEEIKSRGVKDILYMSMDGLAGLEQSVEMVYPFAKVQRCIVHLVRNLYKLCPKKISKKVIKDYKKIYTASNLEEAKIYYETFIEKYEKHSQIIKYVSNNIDHIYNLFNETKEIRKLIYTTNAIESVNSSLRKVTYGKGMFMNKESLMKVLYLRVKDLEKEWSSGTKDWSKIINQLVLQYEERITKYM